MLRRPKQLLLQDHGSSGNDGVISFSLEIQNRRLSLTIRCSLVSYSKPRVLSGALSTFIENALNEFETLPIGRLIIYTFYIVLNKLYLYGFE